MQILEKVSLRALIL